MTATHSAPRKAQVRRFSDGAAVSEESWSIQWDSCRN
jgi:hypothetical protein